MTWVLGFNVFRHTYNMDGKRFSRRVRYFRFILANCAILANCTNSNVEFFARTKLQQMCSRMVIVLQNVLRRI